MTDTELDVICRREGAAGVVMLDRPKALNALTRDMVRAITDALEAWRDDPSITRIVIESTNERAFCAGGDVRRVADLHRAGRTAEAVAFWRDEYRLLSLMRRYPQPIVSLVDGIIMGGGVGLAFHGSHVAASERMLLAMPEAAIGFFPDVGATAILLDLPGEVGTWLAVTGARIGLATTVAAGLPLVPVSSGACDAIRRDLVEGADVDEVLAGHRTAPEDTVPDLSPIARWFGPPRLAEIRIRLEDASGGDAIARKARDALAATSPTSQTVALHLMREAAVRDADAALARDFRIAQRMLLAPDFAEGIRAVLIDKDRSPRWTPATPGEVDSAALTAYLAPDPPFGDLFE